MMAVDCIVDDDDSADESETNENDIAEGVPPTQASTTVANHTESSPPTGSHCKSRAVSHGHPSATVTEESPDESQTVTDKSLKRSKENPPPLS